MQDSPSSEVRTIKIGAVMFLLWGVLHVYAGYLTVMPFFVDGPGANLALFGIVVGAPPVAPALVTSSHIALNFGFDLAGYGVLAIWLSWFMWSGRHVRLAFWITVVMLGIADGAFIYSLLLPGYSPLLEGIGGPVLYVLGAAFVSYGLRQQTSSLT